MEVHDESKAPALREAAAPEALAVSAILVNYRSARETLEAVSSLLETAGDLPLQVLVVENQSGGSDREILEKELPNEAELLPSPENLGFAGGITLAVPKVRGKYILLLNPDTRLLPGTLSALVDFMEKQKDAGAVGPLLVGEDGRIQGGGRKLPTPGLLLGKELGFRTLEEEIPDPPRPFQTGWVVGACMLIRKEAYEEVGGMDTSYFLYFEETDLCRRLAAAGWGVWCHPLARCVHAHGTSSERTGEDLLGKDIARFFLPSQRRYLAKFHGKGAALAVEAALWALALARWMKASLLGLFQPAGKKTARARLAQARAYWTLWRGGFERKGE